MPGTCPYGRGVVPGGPIMDTNSLDWYVGLDACIAGVLQGRIFIVSTTRYNQ